MAENKTSEPAAGPPDAGEKLESFAPPPPPAESPRKASSVTAALRAAPASVDGFLAHLTRCLDGRSTNDQVLMFIMYICRFSSASLELASRAAVRSSARKLVESAFQLPAATTVVLSSAPTPPLAALAFALSTRLKALAAVIGEWRVMNRLWGLIGVYFVAKGVIMARATQADGEKKEQKTASQERFDTAVAYAQTFALLNFFVGENVSYLGAKKVLPVPPVTQGRLALWGARCWALYVAMDIGRMLVERSRKTRAGTLEAAWDARWKTDFMRNLSWAPLTVHWSMVDGPIPDILVGFFGLIPATSQIRELWQSTA